MKRIGFIASIAMLAMTAIACQKEISNQNEQTVPEKEVKLVTINASVPGEISKVAFEQIEGALHTTWESGDCIFVKGDGEYVQYNLLDGAGTQTAVFQGEAATPGENGYTIVAGKSSNFNGKNYLDQVQNGNANTAHLIYNAMLSGVQNYEEFEFSQEWADQNSATFSINSVLKFYLQLPDEISSVDGLTLAAPARKFSTQNNGGSTSELSMSFTNTVVDNHILTAYMMASAKTIELTGNTSNWIVEVMAGDKTYIKEFNPGTNDLTAGQVHVFQLNKTNWYTLAGYGTESKPWELQNKTDLSYISKLLVSHDDIRYKKFFKMTSDIDLDGEQWTPIVTTAQTKNYELDGKNHSNGKNYSIKNMTVKAGVNYPSFAGILCGTIKNVTFDGCSSTNGKGEAQPTAIVAAWGGRDKDGLVAVLNNVNVTNSTVNGGAYASPTGLMIGQANGINANDCTASGNVTMDGVSGSDISAAGFVGKIYTNQSGQQKANTFTKCHADNVTVTVANGRCNAGFVGLVQEAATFTGCTVLNTTVTGNGGSRQAGFVAYVAAAAAFNNCTAEATVSSTATTGAHAGFVGQSANASAQYINCSAKGNITSGGYGVGGFAGQVTAAAQFTDCQYLGGTVISGKRDDTIGLALGGLIGYANARITVSKCSVVNAVINSAITGYFIGGLVGNINTAGNGSLIEKSFVENTKVEPKNDSNPCYIGGILGGAGTTATSTLSEDINIKISNCYSSNGTTVKSGSGYGIGGIVGLMRRGMTVEYCYSTAEIYGGHGLGGLVGRADDNVTAKSDDGYNMTINKCVAFNSSIKSNSGAVDCSRNYSCGAIVGRSSVKNIHSYCWRNIDQSNFVCMNNTYNTLFNQNNSDASSALSLNNITANYFQPYHGKATGGSYINNIIALVQYKDLAWSTDIWDLSGTEPKLK